jgi:hypothetical protein
MRATTETGYWVPQATPFSLRAARRAQASTARWCRTFQSVESGADLGQRALRAHLALQPLALVALAGGAARRNTGFQNPALQPASAQ